MGGVDKEVEIDESMFSRRKYHRGKILQETWVFGLYDRTTKKVLVCPVEDRTAETLLAVIKGWILPGTTIISDKWRAYSCLEKEGYKLLQVNHKYYFKDPESGACTNSIEGTWSAIKAIIPRGGRRKKYITGYLGKYLFNKYCAQKGKLRDEVFFEMAARMYNPIPMDKTLGSVGQCDSADQTFENSDEADELISENGQESLDEEEFGVDNWSFEDTEESSDSENDGKSMDEQE